MRLPRQDQEVLNQILDEAIGEAEGDVSFAAAFARMDLNRLEGGGIDWAYEVLNAAQMAGMKQLVRNRLRAHRVAVADQSMPAYYKVGLQSAQWMHVPVDELEPVIERLSARARSYHEHAAVLIDAQQFAKDHKVDTAGEAFAAEGVPVVELAS